MLTPRKAVVAYYVYVVERMRDHRHIVGYTGNRRRVEEYRSGKSWVSRFGGPWRLIYFEGCLTEVDAKRRRQYFKSSSGQRFLEMHFFSSEREIKKL